MLSSIEATKATKRFIDELNSGELKMDIEHQCGEIFEDSDEYLNKRLESYNKFLKSDLCKKIFELCQEEVL